MSADQIKKFGPWARRFMAMDAAFDNGLYQLWRSICVLWARLSALFRHLRLYGARRFLPEVLSEGLTWGTVGFLVLAVLAKPAFLLITPEWKAQANYSVTFLDKEGLEIGKRGRNQNKPIDLERLPRHFINATLATEDRRFFEHIGIDLIGTLRAMIANAREGRVVQGGSSITQQVAKNVFLSSERTLSRKINEAFLSLWLEVNLTKEEILELYFNRAYMGGGAFGVSAASDFYFNKSYENLSLAESAMLAGLFKAPANYAPHINLPEARARANQVLTNMVKHGFLTEGQALPARTRPATAVNRAQRITPDYFLDWAYDEVLALGLTGNRVLTVTTTLDSALQHHARKSVIDALLQDGETYDVSEAAAVLMTPLGEVRALVGGRDYKTSQFNRATKALRQPGSSFKPFVYAAAMQNGYSPKSVIADRPITIGTWSPQNYTRRYSGNVTLTTALVKSINTVPIRLTQSLGRGAVIDLAKKMGVRTPLHSTPSLPLGTSEVSVMDMASSYSVFANGGFSAPPRAFSKIINSTGEEVFRLNVDTPRKPALSPSATASMNTILSQIPEWGTGRRAKLDDIKTAGKTGTTQSYRDAWFVGFTGDYVGAVWFGNDNFKATNRLTGGSLPAMTWKTIMSTAHKGLTPKPIPYLDGDIPSSHNDTLIALTVAEEAPPLFLTDKKKRERETLTLVTELRALVTKGKALSAANGQVGVILSPLSQN